MKTKFLANEILRSVLPEKLGLTYGTVAVIDHSGLFQSDVRDAVAESFIHLSALVDAKNVDRP